MADGGKTAPAERGILVTGLPRSGTSWVGKMLEASGDVVYVNEPMNPQHPPGHSPGVLNAEVSHRFQYICPDNDAQWAKAFRDTLRLRYHPVAELRRNHALYDFGRLAKYGAAFTVGRARGRRALIDDPFAVFSSAWFAQRLGVQVVVLVRHPVSAVGSWKKLNWTAQLEDLLNQPLLMRDLLESYRRELEALAGSPDRIEKAAMLWRMTYVAVDVLASQQPDLVRVWRYEDLASDPVNTFGKLYTELGLTWASPQEQQIIAATTGTGNTERSHEWNLHGGVSRTAYRAMDSRAALGSFRSRLEPAEIDRVQELTADVSKRYFSAEETSQFYALDEQAH